MAITEAQIAEWTIRFLVFVISALPLYFALHFFRSKVSLLMVLLVTFVAGLVVSFIQFYFEIWGFLIAFVVLIWIYREMFRLKWINAFLVWLLQLVFVIILQIIFVVLLALVFGISGISLI